MAAVLPAPAWDLRAAHLRDLVVCLGGPGLAGVVAGGVRRMPALALARIGSVAAVFGLDYAEPVAHARSHRCMRLVAVHFPTRPAAAVDVAVAVVFAVVVAVAVVVVVVDAAAHSNRRPTARAHPAQGRARSTAGWIGCRNLGAVVHAAGDPAHGNAADVVAAHNRCIAVGTP